MNKKSGRLSNYMKHNNNRTLGTRIFPVLFLCAFLFSPIAYATETVKIGILSYRPQPQVLAQWQPLAVALKQALPEHDFEVQALSFSELEKATANKELDFVLTNPAHYIFLTQRIGLSAPMATLANNEAGQRAVRFGGVIFTRADHRDLNVLSDIKNKSIATTDPDSFGGYLTQAYALSQIGINSQQDNKLIVTGMPHDNVVSAVLEGRAEVGFVRTGVLEVMASEGKLDINKLKVINIQNIKDFPVKSSTPLYPEWAFASLQHVDENLARHVAAALFMLEENKAAVTAINIHGFVVPADYTPVSQLLQELRVKPFDEAPIFTLKDVWSKYKYQFIIGFVALSLFILLGLRLLLISRKLKAEHLITLEQQKKLYVSELHLRTIIKNEPECIKIVDAQGHLLEMNPAGLTMLEADSLEELVGQPVLNVIAPEYRTAYARMHKRVMAGEAALLEYEVIGLKGGRRWLETHAVPVEENGKLVHLAVTRDISENKKVYAALKEKEERLALATLHNGIGVWDLNLQTMELVWDESMFTLYNLKREDFSGAVDAWRKSLHPDDRERSELELQDALSGKKSFDTEFRVIWSNGDVHHIKAIAKVFRDETGKPVRMLGTNVDITDRKVTEDKLRMLSTAIEQSPTSVVITNLDGTIEYINPRFTRVTGYNPEEVLGRNPRVLQSGLTDKTVYENMWSTLTQGHRWAGEFINRDKSGNIFYEEAYISPVKGVDGKASHYVAVKLDITKRKKMEEEVLHLAFYDTLTTLPNRRLLNDRLSQLIASCKRSKNYAALMFMDLDNFKPLNDLHGHAVGDMLLVEVAHRLKNCVRELDTVARFGGDEFVIMLGGLSGDKLASTLQAKIIAEKIKAAVSNVYLFNLTQDEHPVTVEHHCTASIGVIVFDGTEATQDEIMKWADTAMYQAKDAGRNQIVFY